MQIWLYFSFLKKTATVFRLIIFWHCISYSMLVRISWGKTFTWRTPSVRMRVTLAALDWTAQPTCLSGLFPASSSVLSSSKSLSIFSWLLPIMATLCLLLAVIAASFCSGKIKIYRLCHLENWPFRLFGAALRCIYSECGCPPTDAEIFMWFESCQFLHLSSADSKETAGSSQTLW